MEQSAPTGRRHEPWSGETCKNRLSRSLPPEGQGSRLGIALMLVPTLHMRISAKCYETYELVSPFPSYNSIHVPTILPRELSPVCP
jgi:hypothetical protein